MRTKNNSDKVCGPLFHACTERIYCSCRMSLGCLCCLTSLHVQVKWCGSPLGVPCLDLLPSHKGEYFQIQISLLPCQIITRNILDYRFAKKNQRKARNTIWNKKARYSIIRNISEWFPPKQCLSVSRGWEATTGELGRLRAAEILTE